MLELGSDSPGVGYHSDKIEFLPADAQVRALALQPFWLELLPPLVAAHVLHLIQFIEVQEGLDGILR